jgi:septum formation protein
LLAAAGYLFEVLPAEIDETLSAGESPVSGVVRLARAKARAAWRDLNDAPEGRLVLAADTLVVLGNEVFGKPKGIG